MKLVLTSAFVACVAAVSANAQGTFKVQASSTTQGLKFLGTDTFLTSGNGNGAWMVQVLVDGVSQFSGNLTLASSGRINNSTSVVSLPTKLANDIVSVVVRVWSGASSYDLASTTLGAYYGSSAAFNQTLGGKDASNNSFPDPGMVGMTAFTVSMVPVPEPTTMALAGIGGLALLGLRRKTA